jgi:hypothetical protein
VLNNTRLFPEQLFQLLDLVDQKEEDSTIVGSRGSRSVAPPKMTLRSSAQENYTSIVCLFSMLFIEFKVSHCFFRFVVSQFPCCFAQTVLALEGFLLVLYSNCLGD